MRGNAPFNSSRAHNVLFAEADGDKAAARIQAFGDTWEWDKLASWQFEETVEEGGPAPFERGTIVLNQARRNPARDEPFPSTHYRNWQHSY